MILTILLLLKTGNQWPENYLYFSGILFRSSGTQLFMNGTLLFKLILNIIQTMSFWWLWCLLEFSYFFDSLWTIHISCPPEPNESAWSMDI